MGNTASEPEAKSPQPQKNEELAVATRGRQRTLNIKRDSLRVQKGLTLKANLAATLGSEISHQDAVKLPPNEDLNEWLAINTFIFYELAVNVYKNCEKVCTPESCPKMTAGKHVVYLWADGKKVKKPIELSAPDYVEHMFDWVFEQMSDPTIFPPDDHSKFPKSFMKTVKSIYKRLLRLYAHIFHSHFVEIQNMGAEAHLNSSFKHFIFFILEFNLVEQEELYPLRSLIKLLTNRDMGDSPANAQVLQDT
jgi:MOB kinase activator 1